MPEPTPMPRFITREGQNLRNLPQNQYQDLINQVSSSWVPKNWAPKNSQGTNFWGEAAMSQMEDPVEMLFQYITSMPQQQKQALFQLLRMKKQEIMGGVLDKYSPTKSKGFHNGWQKGFENEMPQDMYNQPMMGMPGNANFPQQAKEWQRIRDESGDDPNDMAAFMEHLKGIGAPPYGNLPRFKNRSKKDGTNK